MRKQDHSLGRQAFNQVRSACHTKQFFEGYSALKNISPEFSQAFSTYSDFFGVARKAMKEMAIINVASVLDKQKNSTGMLKLIDEAQRKQPILTGLCENIKNSLNESRYIFSKAVEIRSNIIAHRSKKISFKEAYDKAELTDSEISAAINKWLKVAQELSQATHGEKWNVNSGPGEAAKRLMHDISVWQKLGEL